MRAPWYWLGQVALVCGTSAVLLGGLVARYLLVRPEGAPSVGIFVVEPGSDASLVAARLDSLALLPAPRLWLLYAKLTGADRNLKAGPYSIDRLPPARMLRLFRDGTIAEYVVTIPEGSTIWEVAETISKEIDIPKETFLETSHSTAFLQTVGSPGPTLEGYLFPDTYRLHWHIAPERILRLMTDRFLQVWDAVAGGKELPFGLSRHEIVTMASLVEAEATVDTERPRIAAVYYNRLRAGMRLMADPTVAYAMRRNPRRLLYRDLQIDSPYNTYLYPGLPPGPICNPGVPSLAAAITPLERCQDLYFVAAGDGTHIFSRTHREHLSAKAAARKSRAGVPGPPGTPRGRGDSAREGDR